MKSFRVTVTYRTKRGGIACGITMEAASSGEAVMKAEKEILRGYPARKWVYTRVEGAESRDV